MALLNYTTEIQAERTVSEIEQALAKAGASAVMKEFDPITGQPSTLTFRITGTFGVMSFRLPARVENAQKVINRQCAAGKIPRRYRDDRGQALRVAWRIVHHWTLAQLALIELEQADATELFLTFAVGRNGQTLYERLPELQQAGFLALK